jgi:hypothetical protein
MLNTQVLKDQQGMPMGVFIPMKTWENIVFQYPDIELFNNDIPQWEKDFIDLRLNKAQRHPECLKPVEMLLETL